MATVILEGFLQKQSGGLFLKQKRKWAILKSDGTLSLSKKPELPASTVIFIYELDDVVYRDEDSSISFSSVYYGSIIKAYKFYALETPTFEDWTNALDKVRNEPTQEYSDGRSRYMRETASSFHTTSPDRISIKSCSSALMSPSSSHVEKKVGSPLQQLNTEAARLTLTDEELERQADPVLLIQSGGEPVSMSGYIKKRGGAYGGNTSYKKRFFVLTVFGRVVYFSDQKKTRALGQFSLLNATIQHEKQQEVSVVTPTRVWFLKFESEASRVEWTKKLEMVMSVMSSSPPSSPPSSPTKLSSPTKERQLQHQHSADMDVHRPKFRRNVSLLVRQKSNIDGLGFSALNDKRVDSPVTASVNKVSDVKKAASVSVACVTWNLSESLPKMQQCRFLRQYRKQQIVVVGVQECQSVMYHSFSSRQLSPLDIWLAMVKSLMGDNFTLVASRAMGAIHVCVFVREDVIGIISDVSTAFVPCGLGNVMYNKGAVAVTMKCNDVSFGFICAHLAANQEKTNERNLDFHRISQLVVDQLGKTACEERRKSLGPVEKNATELQADLFVLEDHKLGDEYNDDDVPLSLSPTASARQHQSGRFQAVGPGSGGAQVDSVDMLAREFDRCFFLGDLNYRIDAGKEWTERYLRMAEIMRQQEKQEALAIHRAAHETDLEKGTYDDQIVNIDAVVLDTQEMEVNEADRKSERKIETMLNLIQVGDYGTDDDDEEEECDDETKTDTTSMASAPPRMNNSKDNADTEVSLQSHSVDLTNTSDHAGLDNLRGAIDVKHFPSLTPSIMSRIITYDDLVALNSFKEETKMTSSHSVFEFLLSYDQLHRELGKCTVFKGFVEGPILFKPSYKFDPFTETYDTSRKGRSPAWCDRVLYTPSQVSLEQYRCIHGKFHSDHRAVVAIFKVSL